MFSSSNRNQFCYIVMQGRQPTIECGQLATVLARQRGEVGISCLSMPDDAVPFDLCIRQIIRPKSVPRVGVKPFQLARDGCTGVASREAQNPAHQRAFDYRARGKFTVQSDKPSGNGRTMYVIVVMQRNQHISVE
jgi:hypothetical protein